MARPKLRLLCTSMLVAILLFLYAALLCSCKTAAPEISGTMWAELSLDGQYALTNAAGQTLRYFDLLQYDGITSTPVHFTGGVAAAFGSRLRSVLGRYSIEVGRIEASPIDAMVKYHTVKG